MKTVIKICLLVLIYTKTTNASAQCFVSKQPLDYTYFQGQAFVDFFGSNFPNCEEATSVVIISDNSSQKLQDLRPLRKIKRLNSPNPDNEVIILSNNGLKSFEGLENITECSQLIIADCPNITSLKGLSGIKKVRGGVIVLKNLPNLVSLEGLNTEIVMSESKHLQTKLVIENCPKIKTLSPVTFHLPDSIDEIEILNNKILENLNGITNIKYVRLFVDIIGNENLKDIRSLETIQFSGLNHGAPKEARFLVKDNKSLETCCALGAVINNITRSGERTNVLLSGNSENCNSTAKVLSSCSTPPIFGIPLFKQQSFAMTLAAFPNPTSSIVTLKGNTIFEILDIYNSAGSPLGIKTPLSLETTVDLSNYPAGIYQLKINQKGSLVNVLKYVSISKI